MKNSIKCPKCGHEFEASEGLMSHLKEEASLEAEKKIRAEIEGENKLKLQNLENTIKEKDKKLDDSRQNELKLLEDKRKLEDDKKDLELEVQRKLDEGRAQIEEKAYQKADEDHKFKDLEKDKLIGDLKKSLEDAQRKAQQGSMQTQGEVAELDLEETLRSNFKDDEIVPVAKGKNGADVKQIVKTQRGTVCGVILWESKNTKTWDDDWITKLKQDTRNDKADLPAIVTSVLPKEFKTKMGIKEGVWVSAFDLVIPLAMLLRKTLVDSTRQKVISQNKQDKAGELYTYVTSLEFSQRVEAMVEAYNRMKDQIAKERLVFEKQWSEREKQVNILLGGVAGIYGDIQGIAGSALPTVRSLELDSGDK